MVSLLISQVPNCLILQALPLFAHSTNIHACVYIYALDTKRVHTVVKMERKKKLCVCVCGGAGGEISSCPYLASADNASRRCKLDKGSCHGDLMLRSDGSLTTWLLMWYGRCQAEGAIVRVGNMRVREAEEERNEDVSSSHNALHQHDMCWSDFICHSGMSAIDRHTGKLTGYKIKTYLLINVLFLHSLLLYSEFLMFWHFLMFRN